jgi:hypothetical protein
METSPPIFIIIAIVVLGLVAIIVSFIPQKNKKKKLSPLAGLAFVFILAGIFFSDKRLIGYGLFGIGIVLSVIDIILKFKESRISN